MSGIDERVVEMKFNNGQFQKGVKTTLDSLANLKTGLQFNNATSGLDEVGRNVGYLSTKFSALSVAAVTAFATIVSAATTAGTNILKSLSIDPIMQGFKEYEMNIGAIQTILANTKSKGTNLGDINDALAELNLYSDQTIYNFAQMVDGIKSLTTSGVSLDLGVDVVKGFANAAAVAGVSADGFAMSLKYGLNQAMSRGKMMTQDWMSLETAGMAGESFKNSILDTARVNGIAVDDMIAKNGSFRDSLSEGWLTADIMQQTLAKYTGEMSDAQLLALGYTQEQVVAIQDLAKTAVNSATKVKTVSQLFSVLQESVGSTWSQSSQLLLGDFEQATAFFTEVNNQLGGIIGDIGEARNDALRSWADLGGREDLQNGFLNIIAAMKSVITPISKAWAQIFPTDKQGSVLASISSGFEKFTKALILTEDKMENLRKTFSGVFAVFHMVFTIVSVLGKVVMAVIKPLLKALNLTGDGVLGLTGSIGDWVVSLDAMLQKSKFVTNTVDTVTAAMAKASGVIEKIATAIKNFFGGALDSVFSKTDSAAKKMQDSIDAMDAGPLKDQKQALLDAQVAAGDFDSAFSKAMQNTTSWLKEFGKAVAEKSPELLAKSFEGLKSLGGVISTAFGTVMQFFTGLRNNTEGIGLSVGTAIKNIWTAIKSAMAGVDPNLATGTLNLGIFTAGALIIKKIIDSLGFSGISNIINGAGNSLDAFSKKLKADAIIKIAGAVGILAASLFLIAQIPADKLISSGAALVVLGGVLVGLMAAMDAVANSKGFFKMPVISASLALLAGAMLLLALAATRFAKMDIAEVGKALLGLSGALIASNFARGGKVDAIALFALALAFNTLAKGIVLLASVSWEDLAKAGVVMGSLLGAMKLLQMMKLDGKNLIQAAVAMTILGISMMVLGMAIRVLDAIDWDTFVGGIARMAIALVVVAGAMKLMPKDMLENALAIVALGYGIGLLSASIFALGKMDSGVLTQGLIGLAFALGIIAGALSLFRENAIIGAAAVLVVAYALGILTPIIILLGNTPLEVLAIGLGAIAAVFVLLGVAAYILAPAVPVLLALGIAIGLLGAAAIMTGQGLFLMATGLGVLAALGAPGAVAIAAVVVTLAKLIPDLIKEVVQGIVTFVKTLADNAEAIFTSIASIIIALIKSLEVVVPPLITFLLDTLAQLLQGIWAFMEENVPIFVEAGANIITSILQGFADNIGGIIEAAKNLIVNFLNGLAENLPDIVVAAKDLIVTYINALADNLPDIIAAGANLIARFIEGIGSAGLQIITAAGETLIKFMNGIERWIRMNSKRINDAGLGIASALIEGMTMGITGGIKKVTDAVKGVADSAVKKMKNIFGIHSPSRVFKEIGENVNAGFVQGLKSGSSSEITRAFDNMRAMIKEMFTTATEEIEKQTKALAELNAAQNKDATAIAETTAALAEANKERELALAGLDAMDNGLTKEREQLSDLATEYESVTKRLTDAQEALVDAQKTRSDYNASTKDAYDNFADVEAETKLEDFLANMRLQLTQTADLKAGLEQLNNLGINDKLYQQLVEQGVDALPFISQVLDGGQGSVDELNRLNDELNSVASSLGTDASKALYDAGVFTAEGLVNGLASQQSALIAQMNALADAMVTAIKTKLEIQSPSRVFATLGAFATRGLANGLKANASIVAGASSDIGDGAVSALEKSLRFLARVIPDDLNIEPVITPVLDLSKVQGEVNRLDGMFATKTITVDTSAASAASVAEAVKANQDAYSKGGSDSGVRDVTFVQNNTSPEKLSEVEIYRQTRNQLSQVKGELTV